MITTILIVLVAVVVLIVIIAVLALRYLRADDSDTFDDIPDEPRPRRGADHDSDQLPVGPERRRRQREPVTEAWTADRPGRPADARGQQPGFRDRDTGPRPALPDRAGSQVGAQRRSAAVARSARAARGADPDAATSSWEALSDVDYWAELAADKPPATPAASGSAPVARRAPDGSSPAPVARRAPEGSSPDLRQPAGGPAARGDHGHLSALQRRLPTRSAGALPGRGAELAPAIPPGFDAVGRRGGPRPGAAPRPAAGQRPATGPRSALPPRPQLPAAQAPSGNGHAGIGGPADDDPLTSPSFPAINAADSRSYRTRRSATSQPGITGPNGYPVSPDRVSRPDGYPVQSQAPQAPQAPQAAARHSGGPRPAAQAPPLSSSPGPNGTPAANPYGSYLSAPSAPPAHQPPGYPDAPASRAAAPGYPAAAQPAQGSTWYPPPAFEDGAAAGPSAADGYLSVAGLGSAGPATNGHGHSQPHNGPAPLGYAGIDYGSLRYDDPVYPDADGAEQHGFPAPSQPTRRYDQQGYGGPDPGYGQDGYQGYPGYGTGGR